MILELDFEGWGKIVVIVWKSENLMVCERELIEFSLGKEGRFIGLGY